MLYVFIPLALIFLGVIVFFAVSKKTEPRLRLAAIIALGAIALAVMVCLILVFAGSSSIPVEPEPGDFLNDSSPGKKGGGLPWLLIIFIIILLGFLGIVIYLALKEQKRPERGAHSR
jgi:amino acid transporter